jgi:hypothetical protein
LDLGFLKVIDTDVARGGWLTALEVGSRRILQANQLGETRVKCEGREEDVHWRTGTGCQGTSASRPD